MSAHHRYSRQSWLELLCLCLILSTGHIIGVFALLGLGPQQGPHWRNAIRLRQSGCLKAIKSEASQRKWKADFSRLSDSLVQSLDLAPVVRAIADHAGTRRGREALLGLIGEEESAARRPRSESEAYSARRRRVTDASLHQDRGISQQTRLSLAPIAVSPEQARREYELVEQAALVLNGSTGVTFPPLYGAESSPWDTDTIPDTDHDEWLGLPLDDWTLEHVLQADKVVQTLLDLHEWGQNSETQTWMPSLSRILQSISEDDLRPVHNEIEGSVEIVRQRTMIDPQGKSTFKFRLSEVRFPIFRVLRERESELQETIDKQLSDVIRKQKGSPEKSEYQGRMVLCVPKGEVKAELGIIRGTTDTGGYCYIEPRHMVEANGELISVRNDLATLEEQIVRGLMQTISQASSAIDLAIHAMARLDVVFAKAAFGNILNGRIPKVGHNGQLKVDDFVHPVLALRADRIAESSHLTKKVVSIDLLLSHDQGSRALIISGPNGGGKTVALKSFGVASILAKLSVPIPSSSTNMTGHTPRIDFFENILVEVGDHQSVMEGESTLMAKLNSFSSVIESVSGEQGSEETPTGESHFFLVLMDELGGGTDPVAGGAIAQAVLEKLLENTKCRIVATTHSPRLKSLSFNSSDFHCATVLLRNDVSSDFKLPSYQLQYGFIGDSYALGAASRCSPRLPEDVLTRAASLITSAESAGSQETENVDYLRSLTVSLEQQLEAASNAKRALERNTQDVASCRTAILRLAEAYANHWTELEERMQDMSRELREDESMDPSEVIGETLEILRIAKKVVKTEEELLSERGLKMVSPDQVLNVGESVVLLTDDEWEGTTATIVKPKPEMHELGQDEVVVMPSRNIFFGFSSTDGDESKELIVKRTEVAFWDYGSVWDDYDATDDVPTTSIRESRQRLSSLLSTLSTSPKKMETAKATMARQNSFKSSRQRKASRSKKKKK